MKNHINRIYDLLYSPIVTPHNLLENAELPNYTYVKYYKGKHGLIAEMGCTLEEDNEKLTFYYHFDSRKHLQQVYMKSKAAKKKLIYDRIFEFEREKNDYLETRDKICK